MILDSDENSIHHIPKAVYHGENCPYKRRLLCEECTIITKNKDNIVSF